MIGYLLSSWLDEVSLEGVLCWTS